MHFNEFYFSDNFLRRVSKVVGVFLLYSRTLGFGAEAGEHRSPLRSSAHSLENVFVREYSENADKP
jgi:hypothetical protein